MIRNLRHNGAPKLPPETDPSGESERVPNEAFVGQQRMARWREVVFRILLRAEARLVAPYGIPPEQVHYVDVLIER